MRYKKNDNGFTMVEMIIVLVILAIVTAIAIPVALSIIDSSGDANAAMDAKSIWTSAQNVLNEQLSKDEHFISGASSALGAPVDKAKLGITDTNYSKYYSDHYEGKFFMDITDNDFSNRILSKIENADDIQMLYITCAYFYDCYLSEDDMDKAYKVYAVTFKYYDDDKVYFYDGKKVSEEWPFTSPDSVTKITDKVNYNIGNKMPLQFYCIKKCNDKKQKDTSKPFTYFKKMVS